MWIRPHLPTKGEVLKDLVDATRKFWRQCLCSIGQGVESDEIV